jgi:hypothetical protein
VLIITPPFLTAAPVSWGCALSRLRSAFFTLKPCVASLLQFERQLFAA